MTLLFLYLSLSPVAALWAGCPVTTSGATINRFCSSGLQVIYLSTLVSFHIQYNVSTCCIHICLIISPLSLQQSIATASHSILVDGVSCAVGGGVDSLSLCQPLMVRATTYVPIIIVSSHSNTSLYSNSTCVSTD